MRQGVGGQALQYVRGVLESLEQRDAAGLDAPLDVNEPSSRGVEPTGVLIQKLRAEKLLELFFAGEPDRFRARFVKTARRHDIQKHPN